MSSQSNTPEEYQDPVGYFLEDIEYQGKSDRTRVAYRRVLREFESYLDGRDLELREANHRDCMAFVHQLRGTVAESTVATYASYLHRFYDYMQRVGAFEDNPMALVLEEMDESINVDPARRDLSVADMRAFVDTVSHPLHRGVIVTLLKTGIRAGELCNLDRRDVSIGNPPDDFDASRPRLNDRSGTLFVSAEPTHGREYNGEVRSASNKRQRDTTIPIDGELAHVLWQWLAIRPSARSDAEPLFLSTTGEWGSRLTTDMVHHIVETHAREFDWYRTGGGPEENVTPHYFRHFFTTHLRDRTGDRGIVKFLRGDVAQDIIDTYTHNWGTRVRDVYTENIYSLL